MNTENTAFHHLGVFVYSFQSVEREVEELILLLMKADEEMVAILMSELGFSQKLRTVDVLFSRFIDVRHGIPAEEKASFHKLVSRIMKLCERRNEVIHSKYYTWQNIEGNLGLLRQNSRLRASKGARDVSEEELLPEAFDTDATNITECLRDLDRYRLKVIDWLYDTDGT